MLREKSLDCLTHHTRKSEMRIISLPPILLFCRDSQRDENRNKNTGLVVTRKPAHPVYASGTMPSFLSIIYTCHALMLTTLKIQ